MKVLSIKFPQVFRIASGLLILTVSAATVIGQGKLDSDSMATKTETRSDNLAPTPFSLSGNPTCAQLNALDLPGGPFDSRVLHIIDNFELKIDEQFPSFSNVPFNNGVGPTRTLGGGATADTTRTVSMTTTAGGTSFNWSSTKQITAVIVKGGPNGANVYPYQPYSFGGINGGGTGLTTPGNHQVSHVVFCYGIQLVPSSARATISGRVTDAGGNPVRGAVIQLWNVTTGTYYLASTGSFGYYTFTDVPVSDFYVLSATHGRMSFENNTRSFTLEDDLKGVNFVQTF